MLNLKHSEIPRQSHYSYCWNKTPVWTLFVSFVLTRFHWIFKTEGWHVLYLLKRSVLVLFYSAHIIQTDTSLKHMHLEKYQVDQWIVLYWYVLKLQYRGVFTVPTFDWACVAILLENISTPTGAGVPLLCGAVLCAHVSAPSTRTCSTAFSWSESLCMEIVGDISTNNTPL